VAFLALLAERKINNLRVINTPLEFDSVPGHHLTAQKSISERHPSAAYLLCTAEPVFISKKSPSSYPINSLPAPAAMSRWYAENTTYTCVAIIFRT
jgi:hypothetical protein